MDDNRIQALFEDGGTVVESRSAGVPRDHDYLHLPPAERKKAKARALAKQKRWAAAQEIRATWGPEEFEEEARQIAEQIEEWERNRAA